MGAAAATRRVRSRALALQQHGSPAPMPVPFTACKFADLGRFGVGARASLTAEGVSQFAGSVAKCAYTRYGVAERRPLMNRLQTAVFDERGPLERADCVWTSSRHRCGNAAGWRRKTCSRAGPAIRRTIK